MASDISLAVGDGARRMTYAELAESRGISPASAKRLTQRHHWGRQTGNDGVTRVTVPLSALAVPAKPAQLKEKSVAPDKGAMSPATGATAPATPIAVIGDVAGDVIPVVTPATEALIGAVEELRATIADLRQRLDHERERAERQVDELQAALTEGRRQIDRLHVELADAVTAERIAAGEASALRTIVTGLRERPWWRRWFR